MPKITVSLHGGSTANMEHNSREVVTNTTSAIDPSRSHLNEALVRNIPVREAYQNIFGEALEEYNEKCRSQRHYDRVKTIDEYMSSQEHQYYEYIAQVGNETDGISSELKAQILRNWFDDFAKRNPNLIIIGAYLHLDETSPHIHLDYIPVKESKRGMRVQVSQRQAFKDITGYENKNAHDRAQIQWQDAEREELAERCRDLGLEVSNDNNNDDSDSIHIGTNDVAKIEEDVKQLEDDYIPDIPMPEDKSRKVAFNSKERLMPISEIERLYSIERHYNALQQASKAYCVQAHRKELIAQDKLARYFTVSSERSKAYKQDALQAKEFAGKLIDIIDNYGDSKALDQLVNKVEGLKAKELRLTNSITALTAEEEAAREHLATEIANYTKNDAIELNAFRRLAKDYDVREELERYLEMEREAVKEASRKSHAYSR